MRQIAEGDIIIDFPVGASVRKFDNAAHGLSHCMSAVDYIVDHKDHVYFIEIKDPQSPETKTLTSEEFFQEFRCGSTDNKLVRKFRDSFLYEWASGQPNKAIYYLVLIGWDYSDDAFWLVRNDELRRKLPIQGPKGAWKKPFVRGCAVMNLASWNKALPMFSAKRISHKS